MEFSYEQFKKIKENINDKVSERDSVLKMLSVLRNKKTETEIELIKLKKAQIIIQNVSQITQSALTYQISNLVTTALFSVNEEWPEFKMKIETRHNQNEIDFFFYENGCEQDPLESSGYGVCDIASLALNISIWALNKNRPCFINDEPFRNLSVDNLEKASLMLKMLCEKLNIQIIMVSHEDEIAVAADKVFRVSKRKEISSCKVES